jgi:hypothetical protein
MCSVWYGSGDLARPELGRPIAEPLDQCAELLGVDLAIVQELARWTMPQVYPKG